MNVYCVERGDTEVTVHQQMCRNYELPSRTTEGRIYRIGEFNNSLEALNAARVAHPDAARCLDCCKADLTMSLGVAPKLNFSARYALPH